MRRRIVVCAVIVGFGLAAGCGKPSTLNSGAGSEPGGLFHDAEWRANAGQRISGFVTAALGDGYEVSIGEIAISESGDQLALTDIELFEKASDDGQRKTVFEVHKLQLAASAEDGGQRVSVRATVSKLSLGEPLLGTVDGALEVELPQGRWAKATGTIEVKCRQCGTRQTRIRPPMRSGARARRRRVSAFASEGITIPAIRFGDLDMQIDIKDGRAVVTLATAGDAELLMQVGGHIKLSDPVASSEAQLCVAMTLTEAVKRAEPKLDALFHVISPTSGADAWLRVRISGRLDAPRARPVTECDLGGVKPLPVLPPSRPHVATADAGIVTPAVVEISVARADIDALIAMDVQDKAGVRIVPSMKDGKPNGFKLYAIRSDSIAAKLGFQNGDTVHAVNGVPLTTPKKALEAYEKLKTTAVFRVSVTRRGNPVRLVITVE